MTSDARRSAWTEGSLTDLGTVARGRSRHRPRNDPALFGGQFPFFQTGDVKAAELYLTTYQETYNDDGLAQSRLWPRGTLCITIAANIADAAILGVSGCFPDSVVGFTSHPAQSDVVFVKYLLDYVKRKFENISGGTTQDNLSLDKLLSVSIRYPEIDVQHAIAAVLSAYDDLIENNNRRIAILEEIAQRIYREWFIEFRYPGHEASPVVESELGPIPEGWEWLPVSAVLTINPKIDIDRNATHPFVPMTSLSEAGMHVAPIEHRTGASGARFQNGDTLFARITPSLENGKTAYVQCLPDREVATGSTEFIVFRARKLSPELTYLLARDERLRNHAIQSMVGASGRQRVRTDCFDTFMFAVPPAELVDRFARLVGPMFRLSYELFVAAGNLRSTRDLLLPRVISGDIDVAGLDIAVPDLAA